MVHRLCAMLGRLRLLDGTFIGLSPGQKLVLGRAHASRHTAPHVSRQQCEVKLEEAAARSSLTVTGRGTNPTLLHQHMNGGEQQTLLQAGETSDLQQGDSISLLSSQPGEAILFTSAAADRSAVGQSSAEVGPGIQQLPLCTDDATPAMLVLVGVPGAGKSTFCLNLASQSTLPWTRVCQDAVTTANKQRRRAVCVSLAKQALMSGSNVLVDRCHLDKSQREDFLQLAKLLGCPVHALILKLPPWLCRKRAMARTDHEGKVEGPGAAKVVGFAVAQLEKAGLPSKAEGFASIMARPVLWRFCMLGTFPVCKNDEDVKRALEAWSRFGPACPDPSLGYRRSTSGSLKRMWDNATSKATHQGPAASASQAAGAATTSGLLSPSGDVVLPVDSDDDDSAVEPPAKRPHVLDPPSQSVLQPSDPPAATSSASQLSQGPASGSPTLPISPPLEHAPRPSTAVPGQVDSSAAGSANSGKNAFSAMMAAARMPQSPPQKPSSAPSRSKGQPWELYLQQVAQNPDMHAMKDVSAPVVDEHCVLIHDAYPKARRHALVIARDPALDRPEDLTSEHIPLLQHMQGVAAQWIARQQQLDPSLPPFQLGFHSIPSMRQLHLHVISQDYDSTKLKLKKHWLSFTSAFFLHLDAVLQQLKDRGSLVVDQAAMKALLTGELCCHRCQQVCRTMPALKAHIISCDHAVPR